MKKIAFITVLIFNIFFVFSENIQLTASAPKVVESGQQFEITFSINGNPSGFKPPDFKNFSVLGGPSNSSSTNVQIVNGRMSQSITNSYTYYLQAGNPGTYTIDPAKATVDGKNYTSNSISIEVVKGQASATNKGTTPGNQSQQGESQEEVAQVGNEDVFVRILVDKTTLYQGESLVATIKLFSRLNISSIENAEYPSFTGFFRQDIETQPLRSLQQENVNGKIYYTGIIQKMILFPQQSGQLVIDPFVLQCVVQQQIGRRSRSVFDDFFGPSYQEVRKKIQSLPVKIVIKPLPMNKPESFKGAVGDFTFKSSINKNKVKSNEAITLKISISGNGNLKMIEPFEIGFPTDFDTYDPKITINATASNAGVFGSKTFEYLVIPRHSGKFKIPGVDFTFFDTKSKQYKTLTSEDFDITVEKSADEGANAVVSGVSKEDVRFIGKDIQYIITQIPDFKKKDTFFFGTLSFYLFYLVSSIVFIICLLLWRKRIKDNANVLLVKNRRANKVAKKRLREANQSLKTGNKEQFYENILKALWGYMSDKLTIPVSELSREKVQDEVRNRNIDIGLINKFLEITDACEYARYAPLAGSSKMDSIYNDAVSLLSSFEQKVK
jgi:hypothetical protein